jgi:quinoprotein glucose dehydrogenase
VRAWLVVGALAALVANADADPHSGWAYYGGDADGIRYSSQDQITPANVQQLELAWRHSTGEVERRGPDLIANSSTQTTPILFEGSLLFCTPFNRIVALDERYASVCGGCTHRQSLRRLR